MLDPNQSFIISRITRKGIADDLNEYFVDYTGDDPPLKPDDERLTDKICEDFCEKLSNLAAETADDEDSLYQELCFDTLVLMGIDPAEALEPPDLQPG